MQPARSRRPANEGFVALKTIAAYRGGLDRVSEHVVAALEANEATGAPLPVQVHCGFGDWDLHLWRADPSYLKPLVERFRETPFVLLHCYPFVREAGWLAHVYGNVWFDLSLTIPHVSRPAEAVREALELAPVSKLLYASDAARTPELYSSRRSGGATPSPRCSATKRTHGSSCARTRSGSTACSRLPTRSFSPAGDRAADAEATAHAAQSRERELRVQLEQAQQTNEVPRLAPRLPRRARSGSRSKLVSRHLAQQVARRSLALASASRTRCRPCPGRALGCSASRSAHGEPYVRLGLPSVLATRTTNRIRSSSRRCIRRRRRRRRQGQRSRSVEARGLAHATTRSKGLRRRHHCAARTPSSAHRGSRFRR